MAWQLIYTSAPRLLEAGRSGFGTVARHRGIHPLLVTAIERDSQFDRAVGRFIYAHRILTAAGKQFHVLSCVRDAGSDYTGRTNHLAHHLIFEPHELAVTEANPPTPADVLSQMEWQTSWSDSPRWLDGTDEISLARFHGSAGSTQAWLAATGESRRVALLQPGRSMCIILPKGVDALGLYAESLSRNIGQAWQSSFTTALQSGDELGDFLWAGVFPNAARRGEAESGRTVLDLTAPETLPIPAEAVAGPVGSSVAPRSAGTLRLPVPSAFSKEKAKTGSLFDEKLAELQPGRGRSKQPRAVRGAGFWLGVAAVVALVAVGVIAFALPLFSEGQAIKKQRADIQTLWRQIFSDESGTELTRLPKEKLPLAFEVLGAAEEVIATLQRGVSSSLVLSKAQSLVQQAQKEGLAIPPRLTNLLETYAKMVKSLSKVKEIEKADARPDQLQDLELLAAELQTLELPKPASSKLRYDIIVQVEDLQVKRIKSAIDALTPESSLKYPADWFEARFAKLPQRNLNFEEAKIAKEIIADWKIIGKGKDQEAIKTILETHKSTPAWLLKLAKEKLEPEKRQLAGSPILAKEDMPPSPSNGAKVTLGKLFIVSNVSDASQWREFNKYIKENGVLSLVTNDAKERKFKNFSAGFRLEAIGPLWFERSGGDLIPKEQIITQPPPYEVVITDGGHRLATAWVPKNGVPLQTVNGGIVRHGHNFTITDANVSELVGITKENNWEAELELEKAFLISPGNLLRIPVTKNGADVSEFAKENATRIKSLELEIEKNSAQSAIQTALAAVNTDKGSNGANSSKLTSNFDCGELGTFCKSYGHSSEYEDLFNAAEELAKQKGKVRDAIPALLLGLEKTIQKVSNITGSGNSKEMEKAEKARQAQKAPLLHLKILLETVRDEERLANQNSSKMEELERLRKNPLQQEGVLPPGNYRIILKGAQAGEVTLIQFAISR